ncbi:hypothetical protein ACFLS9_02135 [Bacteroidota bacterium]
MFIRTVFFSLFISVISIAQINNQNLSGHLKSDMQYLYDYTSEYYNQSEQNTNIDSKKSPFLAGLFSLVIPGAGEFYSESYLKSAIFFALEVTAVSLAIVYDKKGNDQTELFENYANKSWDVSKYARWTIDNLETHLNIVLENNLNADNYSDLFYDEDRTQVNWDVLNQLESDIGGWYSHRLEQFGHQQYYEMIGKYQQFNPGWDDFDENSLFTYTHDQRDPVTDNFEKYSQMRGKANDFYNTASTAVIIIVANHIISALDAAWTASRYNKQFEVKLSLERNNFGFYSDISSNLNFKYNF